MTPHTPQPQTPALGKQYLLPVCVCICPFWTFHTDGVIHVVLVTDLCHWHRFLVHPCCRAFQHLIPFCGQILFPCMNRPPLLSVHLCLSVDFCSPVHALLFPFPLFSSCCFLPRPGRRSSPSPPPGEEKDQFEVWAPVVDSEAPPLESPTLPPTSSPSCCGFARPDEGISASQPVRRVLGGDHAVTLDPGQLETVLEK